MMRLIFRLCVLVVLMAALAAAGCSSDPDSPLGTEFVDGGLIGSQPGQVFQDTIPVAGGDTSFVTNALMTGIPTMKLSRQGNVETAMLLRVDFSNVTAEDQVKRVSQAQLGLRVTSAAQMDVITAEFFELLSPFSQSDTMTVLNLPVGAIPDTLGVTDRTMALAKRRYELPPTLVQDWIRGNAQHNGIAIVTRPGVPDTTVQLTYGTRENGDTGLRPFLTAFFTDGSSTRYEVSDDGTFVRAPVSATKLIISDGVTRRIFLPIDLSSFSTDFLLHGAELTLHPVPGSSTPGDLAVTLYAPSSSNPADSLILVGTTVVTAALEPDSSVFRLPVRTIIEDFLALPGTNHGLVLRYLAEGTDIRQTEFFGSADSLGPVLSLTFSEAPKFPKPK